jgi:hypothetical protein
MIGMKALFTSYLVLMSFQLLNARNLFKDIVIQTDTTKYYFSKNANTLHNERYFFFKVKDKDEVCEVTFLPEKHGQISHLHLIPSSDFAVLDTFMNINGEYFRGKIQFKDLSATKFIRIVVQAKDSDGRESVEEFKLYPYFETKVYPPLEEQELYINEDKYIELKTDNFFNIKVEEPSEWQTTPYVDFKFVSVSGNLKILVHPRMPGNEVLKVKLKTNKPFLNELGQLSYELLPVNVKLSIKPPRINFLNLDVTEFFYDPSFSKNNEVQLDYLRSLPIKRTYRIEDQQEPGGRLIAELYTVSQVGSSKILCWLRTYSLHRKSEGYLFVKEGDQTRFMTNFDIIQHPRIDKVSIMKEGGLDWQNNLTVSPGETIEVKIDGTGLMKADVLFDIGANYTQDTARRTDGVMFFNLKIPVEINKRKIALLLNKNFIGYELQVKEYQRPRDFDFVSINFDGLNKHIVSGDKFIKPVLYPHTIEDISFSFDPKKIDHAQKIYGKQYFSIEIKLFNEKKDLIEFQKIDNISICPGENSPRFSFYDTKDCQKTSIGLNQYLIHKTFDLDGWSTIELTFKHIDSKYSEPSFTRKVFIIKEKYILLDMQVSFPAGLLVKRFGEEGFGRFSGISTAFLAQLSFYDRHKIGKLKPYKLGAGLIALDVFNANQSLRDLGLVVLGSLSPLRSSRFTFPIYLGGGYFIQSNRWFLVFGPGIQFNF